MNNSKEFMIINVIVSFGRGEQPREIGTRMSVAIRICLEEYPPEACLEASVAIAKVLVLLGRESTGSDKKQFFGCLKVGLSAIPYMAIAVYCTVRIWSLAVLPISHTHQLRSPHQYSTVAMMASTWFTMAIQYCVL